VKTIRMLRDFDYKPRRSITIAYQAGHVYKRVPEAAARDILRAEAGEVLRQEDDAG
jgi:hypothetical protein